MMFYFVPCHNWAIQYGVLDARIIKSELLEGHKLMPESKKDGSRILNKTQPKLEFKHLSEELCGPHCCAKDNGSSHYVYVGHCDKCHEERNISMDIRPMH